MRRPTRDWLSLATSVACVGALGSFGCLYDDSTWQLDQESGATTSRGASSSTSATGGKGNSGSTSKAGNTTGGSLGAGGASVQYPEPQIDSMDPVSGPYAT